MKGRHVAIGAGVLLLLLVAAVVAVNLRVAGFLRSPEFMQITSDALGRAMNGTARIESVQWTGSSAYAEAIEFEGPSVLRDLTLRQVRLDWDWRALLRGAWGLRDISITQAAATFGEPAAAADKPAPLQPSPTLPGWLPRRFEIEPIQIASANIAWRGGLIEGTRLTIDPDGENLTFSATGGTLRVGDLPALTLKEARGRRQGPVVFLTSSQFRLGASGEVEAAGEIGGGGAINVTWQGVDLADLPFGSLTRHLRGVAAGNAEVRDGVRGDFRITDGRVEEVPVLSLLATFTGNPAFRRMPVQELRGLFTVERGTVTLRDIVLESRGLLRLEGGVTIAPDGALAGTVSVGVTPQALQWIPGSREKVFTESRDGYLWSPVKLSGTARDLREDLSARLAAAMGEQIIEQGASAVQDAGEKARDGVRGVLDVLAPLLR